MNKKFKNIAVKGTFLSTGIIAQYCDTTTVQVSRWIKNGDLKAFRTPGGQYRVTPKAFREFLERHNMPIVEDFFKGVEKKKILIADDDIGVIKAYSLLLENHFSVEIETASDGYEALIKTGSLQPDILILDIRMPKIDGLEVCRRIREDTTTNMEMKIIAVTAHSETYDRDTVINAGADDYLIKPIEPNTLLEHIDKLI